MPLIDINVEEIGATGLVWLLLTYGFVLFQASNLISEGSDLLLLIPSLAGLVGGVVLPLLGAVPDGAIMLFSGLGEREQAQETLSVGVGALAGSTIMLLTVPWFLSVFGGRVDMDADGSLNYSGKPKLAPKSNPCDSLLHTGVAITDPVSHGAKIMIITTIPYFLIQVPGMFIGDDLEEVAEGERYWALGGLIICLIGFVTYLALQLRLSQEGEDKDKRVAVVKKMLLQGKVSLSGALADVINTSERTIRGASATGIEVEYGAIPNEVGPDEGTMRYLKDILFEAFRRYDEDNDGTLDKREVKIFFRDFHEDIDDGGVDRLFSTFDINDDGTVSFDEFIRACYIFIKESQKGGGGEKVATADSTQRRTTKKEIARSMFATEDEEEVEDIPEEFESLSPEEQQYQIKKKAFLMLFVGTTLVILFSDPMVDVMQEIANRLKFQAFYVSFLLAPLASNASEVLASMYYSQKKTRKTITVALTALEGAASMNNTFCLSIFMGLIFFRRLAWKYTAETIAIVSVQVIMGILVQRKTMSLLTGVFVLCIFPLSVLFVALMEKLGVD